MSLSDNSSRSDAGEGETGHPRRAKGASNAKRRGTSTAAPEARLPKAGFRSCNVKLYKSATPIYATPMWFPPTSAATLVQVMRAPGARARWPNKMEDLGRDSGRIHAPRYRKPDLRGETARRARGHALAPPDGIRADERQGAMGYIIYTYVYMYICIYIYIYV